MATASTAVVPCKDFPVPLPPRPPIETAKEMLFNMLPNEVDADLRLTTERRLDEEPGFSEFFTSAVDRRRRLIQAKPVLIQGEPGLLNYITPLDFTSPRTAHSYVLTLYTECLAHDPWKVLIAVMLLNQTSAQAANPVLFEILERWSSPSMLAQGASSPSTLLLAKSS